MRLQEIAQQIVDATMEVIDNRIINIMDRDGLIIASGDKRRIHTYHQGAALVNESGATIEIYPEELHRYPGAKEGLNMPITVAGKTLGVVGVNGHPDEVRIIANLVKKTVELNIEQHLLAEQIKLAADLKQQILRKLIYEHSEKKVDELEHLAKFAEVDLTSPHCAIVFKPNKDFPEPSLHILKIAPQIEEHLLERHYLHPNDLFGVINPYYVCFKKISAISPEDEPKQLAELREEILTHCRLDVRIAMGSHHPGLSGYKKSFQEAKTLLHVNSQPVQTMSFPTSQVDYLLSQIDDDILSHFLIPLHQRLMGKNHFEQRWIFSTVDALAKHHFDPVETGKALHIHKNTMAYRLKRLEEISGLSLRHFENLVILKLLTLYWQQIKITFPNEPAQTD